MGEAGGVGEEVDVGVGEAGSVGAGSVAGAGEVGLSGEGSAVARGKVGTAEGAGLLMATGGWAVGVADWSGTGVGSGVVEQAAKTSMTATSNRWTKARFMPTLSSQTERRSSWQGPHGLNSSLLRSVHRRTCAVRYVLAAFYNVNR